MVHRLIALSFMALLSLWAAGPTAGQEAKAIGPTGSIAGVHPKNQVELALELIDKLSGTFEPQKYKDTYTEKLKQIVNAKKKGKRVAVKAPKGRRTTAVPDIVSRLKESLAMSHR